LSDNFSDEILTESKRKFF